MRLAVIVSIFFFPAFLLGQQKEKLNRKVTLRAHVGIPRSIGSSMFRTAFNGIVETGLSGNYRITHNFFMGAGYQFTRFLCNKQLFAFYTSSQGNLSYKTTLDGHSGFIKMGIDKFFSDIGYVSYSLNAGFSSAEYLNIVPADSLKENRPLVGKKFTAPYLQPEIAVNFLAEERVSLSVLLSYTFMFYKFDPKAPRFNHITEIRSARNGAPMNWINLGFGVNILLGKQ